MQVFNFNSYFLQRLLREKDFLEVFKFENEIIIIDGNNTSCPIQLNFTRENYKSKGIIFRNFFFDHGLTFDDVSIKSGIKFQNCTFANELLFYKVSSEEFDKELSEIPATILFTECRFNAPLKILNSTFENSIQIFNCNHSANQFSIDKIKINKGGLEINNTPFHLLSFKGNVYAPPFFRPSKNREFSICVHVNSTGDL